MNENKRMVGKFEIIQSLQIGDHELVIGENQADSNEKKYMTAIGERNDLFERFDNVLVSDDYAQIVAYFGQRIAQQAEKTHDELMRPKIQGIDETPITAAGCHVVSYADDLNDKIIVIKPEVLRREYCTATHQLKLCTGGFGAFPNSRGSAVFCKDIYTGQETRFERQDVLGYMDHDQLPKWAKHFLQELLPKQEDVHEQIKQLSDEQPTQGLSEERKQELKENFNAETNDPETEEWRADLTPEERQFVENLDQKFDQGMSKLVRNMAEAVQKPHRHRSYSEPTI